MKSIVKNVAIITAFSILTRFLGFLFRIFLSRTIGSEALGIYQVALSIFMVLLTIVSSGFTLIISRMTAGNIANAKTKDNADLVSTCLLISLVLSVSLCVIVLIFKGVFKNVFTNENCINILIILLPSLIFSAFYSVFRGAMWGNNNYFGLCVSEFVEQIVKISICVLLLGSSLSALQGAKVVAWSFTISCFVSALLVFLLFFFYGGQLGKPTKVYKSVIRQATPITSVRVLSSFTQPLVALILPARLISAGYTASQAMSIYGVALGMTFPLLFLPSALISSLTTALVPDISMAFVRNDYAHIERRVQTSFSFTLIVSFFIVPVFIAVGDSVGLFLYDNALSGTLLQFSAWIMIPMGLTNVSSAILNSVGYEVKSFINYLSGDIFMFLSLIILPKYIGINSLIIGMGMSYVISSTLNILMIRKKLKIRVDIIHKIALLILLSLPTVAITSFTSSLLRFCLPSVLNLAFSCCLGVSIFVVLCLIFNVINFSTFKIVLQEKITKKRKNA